METQIAKFELGQVVATPGASNAFRETGEIMGIFLNRHVNGDWGDLDHHDTQANNAAIAHEGDMDQQSRILSAYQLNDGTKFWIITEWDRSVTTILLPSEY